MPTSKPLENNLAPHLEVPATSTPAASVDFSVATPVAANNTISVAMSPAEPFVTAGSIPQHLADVPRATKIKNTHVITTSRVITNDEYEKLLLQKKEKVERIEKEKCERKEGERKKALKESRREENKAKVNPRKKTKKNYTEFESESSEEETNKERAPRKSMRNKGTKLSRILKKTWSTDESELEDDVDLICKESGCGCDLQGKAANLIKFLRRTSNNEHDSGETDDMCGICHIIERLYSWRYHNCVLRECSL